MYNDWTKSKIAVELGQAEKSRREGYEGRARVCARRAAGIAIREYFLRHGIPEATGSTLGLIHEFVNLPDLPEEMRRSAEILILRVDESFQLPLEVDLIAVARTLIEELEQLR